MIKQITVESKEQVVAWLIGGANESLPKYFTEFQKLLVSWNGENFELHVGYGKDEEPLDVKIADAVQEYAEWVCSHVGILTLESICVSHGLVVRFTEWTVLEDDETLRNGHGRCCE